MISLILESKNKKQTHTHKYREQIGGWGVVVREMGEGSIKVQTSSYKINKSWRYNVQTGDYSYCTGLTIEQHGFELGGSSCMQIFFS